MCRIPRHISIGVFCCIFADFDFDLGWFSGIAGGIDCGIGKLIGAGFACGRIVECIAVNFGEAVGGGIYNFEDNRITIGICSAKWDIDSDV